MQSKEFIDAGCTIRFENLHDAKPITVDELEGVVLKPLTYLTTNEERLNLLDVVKEPYLFSSDDLEKILYVTESTKTRLEMIHLVGPRLLDPHVKTEKLIGMFRFAEEKEMVEEVLKARTHTLAIQTGEGGYTYLEVVRRNYTKQYEGWDHHQLEEYIGEAEFAIALGRTKVRFDSSVRGLSVR
ncbi:hypothetical protein B484DRAFT_394151 [Ochromonadaceae sp. CCMP2298]|nr:hypothetical protein B484DRAFT_394151 [Ochromonadaceae sp. CCMP2298]